jgi:beta-N-acetylhexosaminidase
MNPRSVRPEYILIMGIIFILLAVLVGVTAWGAILLLQNQAPEITRLENTEDYSTPIFSTMTVAPPTSVVEVPVENTPQLPTPTMIETPTFPALTATQAVQTMVLPSQVDVESLLTGMSLEQKIGQMIMTGVPGQTMTGEIAALIRDYQIGAVVFFGENTHDAEQTLRFTQALQQTAITSNSGVPLLIAVDHEGGEIFRFQQGLTHFPNPMALGAAHSLELTRNVAAANALELKAVGVNVSLAPVLDVNDQPLNPVIGLRAFAGYPDLAAETGAAYIQGLQSNGVIAAAKHFPGHGSTTVDSHVALPFVDKTEAELEKNELVPFRAAVNTDVAIIMVGHIALPRIDPARTPASLSPTIIQGLLRQKLGFQGVAMTDSMSMGAVAGDYTVSQAAVLAVQAGCDLLAYTSPEAAITARNILLAAVRNGSISLQRVDEAARRVLLLKKRFGLFSNSPQGEAIDREAHQILAVSVAQQAITAVGASQYPLLSTDRVVLVTPDTLPVGSVTGDGLSLLGELLSQRGVQVDEFIYSVRDAGQIQTMQSQARTALANYPLGIVVTWDARIYQGLWGNPAQVNLVNALSTAGAPLILVAGNSPYDLTLARGAGLAIYGGLNYQVEALVNALLSDTAPSGSLPVPLR